MNTIGRFLKFQEYNKKVVISYSVKTKKKISEKIKAFAMLIISVKYQGCLNNTSKLYFFIYTH